MSASDKCSGHHCPHCGKEIEMAPWSVPYQPCFVESGALPEPIQWPWQPPVWPWGYPTYTSGSFTFTPQPMTTATIYSRGPGMALTGGGI